MKALVGILVSVLGLTLLTACEDGYGKFVRECKAKGGFVVSEDAGGWERQTLCVDKDRKILDVY